MTAYLLAALAAVLAIIASYARGRIVGAKLERTANKAKEADSYEQHLREIAGAANARAAADRFNADPERLRDDDGHKRE